MRLTQIDRDLFVNSVLDDMPAINYQENFSIAANEVSAKKMPAKLKAVWDDKNLRAYLKRDERVSGGKAKNEHNHRVCLYSNTVMPVTWEEVPGALEMQIAANEQYMLREEIRSKLKVMINSVSTRKQAAERFPEFVKYLPDAPTKVTPNLPATDDLLNVLKKAGWPDGKKPK